jgi:outer membrane immunogenic protein
MRDRAAIAVFAVVVATTTASAGNPQSPNWTGPYIGINAGGSWGQPQSKTIVQKSDDLYFGPDDVPNLANAGAQSVSSSGFSGGGQIGYNRQIGGLVWGLESSISANGFRGSKTSKPTPSAYIATDYTVQAGVQNDWLWTVRPRLGITSGRLLAYVTGGLAVGNIKATLGYREAAQQATASASVEDVKTGWVVGAGLELLLTQNWSLKSEVMRVDLGTVSTTTNNVTFANGAKFPGSVLKQSVDFQENIVTIGLNYRF